MASYPTIRADFTRALGTVHGWPNWTLMNSFGRVAASDAPNAWSGRYVHRAQNGEFLLGATGNVMPFLNTRSTTSLDVATDAHNSYGGALVPDGSTGFLIAKGPFELETTEFDKTKTWNTNDLIYSPTTALINDATSDEAGMLFKTKNWKGGGDSAGTPGVDKVVGVASWGRDVDGQAGTTAPTAISAYLVRILTFWPIYAFATN